MQIMTLDKLNDLGTRTYETAKHLGELNNRVGRSLIEKQVQLVDFCLKSGMEQLHRVRQAKTLQDVLAANTEYVQGVTERLISDAREAADLTAEARNEFTTLLGDRVPTLDAPASAAAEKAA